MRFNVAYIDNPWAFDTKTTGGTFKSAATQKYPVMALADICALPVPAILSHTAVVFLWVPTVLKFSHGLAVMNAWQLDYITTVYWDKQKNGMGYWFRNTVEELLVCQVRGGSIAPFGCQDMNMLHLPPDDLVDDIVHERVGEHSTKPEAFRRLIERATGKISRRQCVELFARKTVPGWTSCGNYVTKRDIRTDLRLLAQATPDDTADWPLVKVATS